MVAPDAASPSTSDHFIGVLNLQGDVREHLAALADVGCVGRPVKRPADLDGLAGLILPGGESTTLSMLLTSTGLYEPLARRMASGWPVFGTCAGLILLAREVLDGRPDQRHFGVLDAVVRRNGYGRQAQSFQAELLFGSGEGPPLPSVFIRAPLVVSVGPDVEVLAALDDAPVLVRHGHLLAAAFHPELTPDRRVHRLFAEMCVATSAADDVDGHEGEGEGEGGRVGLFAAP